jgi:hypothetical protein
MRVYQFHHPGVGTLYGVNMLLTIDFLRCNLTYRTIATNIEKRAHMTTTPDRTTTESFDTRQHRLWREFLSLTPTPAQLLRVTRENEELAPLAWTEFLKSKPSAEILREVITNHFGRVAVYASAELLAAHPSDDNALHVLQRMYCMSDGDGKMLQMVFALLRNPANVLYIKSAEWLLANLRPQNEHYLIAAQIVLGHPDKVSPDLLASLTWKVPSLAEQAAEKLFTLGKAQQHLVAIIPHSPAHHERAWTLILESLKNHPNEKLHWLHLVIEHIPSHATEAADMVLEMNIQTTLVFHAMRSILKHCPERRQEAWHRVLEAHPSNVQLECVAREVQELSEDALSRRVVDARTVDTVMMELIHLRRPAPEP